MLTTALSHTFFIISPVFFISILYHSWSVKLTFLHSLFLIHSHTFLTPLSVPPPRPPSTFSLLNYAVSLTFHLLTPSPIFSFAFYHLSLPRFTLYTPYFSPFFRSFFSVASPLPSSLPSLLYSLRFSFYRPSFPRCTL